MLTITVIQPPYHWDSAPDKQIADFLIRELKNAPAGALIVLPEYANAGGLTDRESLRAALPRANKLLSAASQVAKEKAAYVSVNVLEDRDGKLRNSTYLFGKDGSVAFIYDKVHLPPSEVCMGIVPGDGACICDLDGIRFGFMTCYDVYFNEQLEYIAKHKPDILLIPGYQRGERTDIIRAQAKLAAFRCNAFVARASYSMNDDLHGGCSMIVAADGQILKDMRTDTGSICADVDPKWKYMRTAGFGGSLIRSDDFIANGLCPEVFQ